MSRALLAEAIDAEAELAHEAALDLYQRVRRDAGHDALGREASRRRAELLLRLGRNDDAAVAFEALVTDCERAGVAAEQAHALAERAHVAYRSGDGPGITRWAERAEAVARGDGTPAVIAHALRYVGIGHEFAGRHGDAERIYLELLELAPDTRHLGPVCNSLGEIARASGRYALAASWYRRSHDEWRRTRGDGPDIVYLNNLGATLVELGRRDEGRALLDRAILEQRRSGWLAMLSETYAYRALAALGDGDVAAAHRDAVEGYLLASQHGETEMMGVLLRVLARIRWAGGGAAPRASDATAEADASPIEIARRSVAFLEQAAKPAEVARSRWLLGELLAAAGDPAANIELVSAQAAFTALGLDLFAEAVARAAAGQPTFILRTP